MKQMIFSFALAVGAIALMLGSSAVAGPTHPEVNDFMTGAPEGFVPPPLHPQGTELSTRKLGEGVYALVSGRIAVDNSGFVVGRDGVLVVDAHINAEMARQIQQRVREVTDKPILYLVNTNYHGDHTFGNHAFPSQTRILAHSATARRMQHIDHEKRLLMPTVNGDRSVYGDAVLRMPDLTFDERLRIDLGDRIVELRHFGHGNTPGDTVVYVPSARVAWTGNLVLGIPLPPIFEGKTVDYLETISRFSRSLDVKTIVPGHGPIVGREILGSYLAYLNDLIGRVDEAADSGLTLQQTLDTVTLSPGTLPADSGLPEAAVQFVSGLHLMNVQQTYLDRIAR